MARVVVAGVVVAMVEDGGGEGGGDGGGGDGGGGEGGGGEGGGEGGGGEGGGGEVTALMVEVTALLHGDAWIHHQKMMRLEAVAMVQLIMLKRWWG